MICKICGSSSELIFKANVLERHDVSYFFCSSCDFIQTEEPYWLQEAYQDAVSIYDVWSVARPLNNSAIVARLIDHCFPNADSPVLDYGGGSGIFVRRMRDIGYNFIRSDAYSKNLYARCFDIVDFPDQKKFSLVTSFEVFEHLVNPLEDVRTLFKYADSIYFTTIIKPSNITKADDWDYIAPYHGQHISFYSVNALKKIAELTGSKLISDRKSNHFLTKSNNEMSEKKFLEIVNDIPSGFVNNLLRKAGRLLVSSSSKNKAVNSVSLTEIDSLYIIKKLDKKNSH